MGATSKEEVKEHERHQMVENFSVAYGADQFT